MAEKSRWISEAPPGIIAFLGNALAKVSEGCAPFFGSFGKRARRVTNARRR